jgi:hypothetical protein
MHLLLPLVFTPLCIATFGGFGAAFFSVRGFFAVGVDFVFREDFGLDFGFEGSVTLAA